MIHFQLNNIFKEFYQDDRSQLLVPDGVFIEAFVYLHITCPAQKAVSSVVKDNHIARINTNIR